MGKFFRLLLKRNLKKSTAIGLGILLLIVFPTVRGQESLAQEADYQYMLEDFEGIFVSQSGYGSVPANWTAGGDQVVVFAKGRGAHHGQSGLEAIVGFDPESMFYSYIERTFQGQAGSLVDLRIQIRLSTTGQASAVFHATSGIGSKSIIRYWSSTTTAWETLTLEDVEVPSDGEVEITLMVGHDSASGSTVFDWDCLSSDTNLIITSPTYDATGTWNYSTFNVWTDCPGDDVSPETGSVTITQSGNSFEVTDEDGTFAGSVSGATYTYTASYAEDGGTVTETTTFTLTSSTSGSGNTTWDWTDGIISCSGGHEFSTTKQAAGDGGGGSGGGGGG